MKKMLTHNLGLKLCSLVLAFVLWFLIIQIDNPRESKSFTNIPVQLRNEDLLAKEDKVFQVADDSNVISKVTVVAPRSVIEQLHASDITAYADMRNLTELNTIEIKYDVAGVDSVSGSHGFVQLNVEDRVTKWIRVTSSCIGEPAEGFQITDTKLQQNSIEVTGPKSVISEIEYAKAEINVQGQSSDLTANVPVKLYGKDDKVISGDNLTKNSDSVYMTVEILATKTVPVEVKIKGDAAEGYMATGEITIEPAEVTLAARQATLAGINRVYLYGDSLDISGATDDVTFNLNMRDNHGISDNIKFADSSYKGDVKVIVEIKKIIDKKLDVPTYKINLVNIPSGYEAVLAEEDNKISVRVSGLEQLITSLTGNGVTGRVDVGNWMRNMDISELRSGTFSLPIQMTVPDGVEVLEDVSIRVMISKQETEE